MEKMSTGRKPHPANKHGQVDEDGFVTAWEPCWFTGIRWVCVSVKISPDKVQVRDTKDPNKTTLTFNHDEWKSFITGVKDGQFDV